MATFSVAAASSKPNGLWRHFEETELQRPTRITNAQHSRGHLRPLEAGAAFFLLIRRLRSDTGTACAVALRPPIIILDTYNVIFAQIAAGLHFY
jgi:hypothetical protein